MSPRLGRLAYVAVPVTTLALVCVASVPAASAAVAPAQVQATYTDGAGVVHYAFDPNALPSSTVAPQQGKRSPTGGCRFTDSGEGAKASKLGPTIEVSRELTFDAANCKRDLAVAKYRASSIPPVVAQRLGPQADALAATRSAASRGAAKKAGAKRGASARAAAYSYSGYLKLNVEDPPQIDVTSTTANVQWNASGCVGASYHAANWGWYSPSGWDRTNASWNYDNNCSRAYTNTYGKFRNGVFCLTIDTWTEHKKTWFEGRPYGGWYWSYSVDKWGGCTGLLHYEHIVGHP